MNLIDNRVIDLKELRMGNLLLYKEEVVYVTSLSYDIDDEYQETIGFCKLGHANNEHSDWNRALCLDLKRILLSPEWLERCGFAWDKENEVFTIQVGNALYLEVDKDFDCALTPEHLPGESLYTWSVNKYVHRLQNLVFALIGTELEIKLP